MTKANQELVEAVKAHALTNYEADGWDFIECPHRARKDLREVLDPNRDVAVAHPPLLTGINWLAFCSRVSPQPLP